MSQPLIQVCAVIAAPPGLMRNSLQSLLRAIPQVSVIALTDTLENVPQLLNAQRVDFLLLDADLAEHNVAGLARSVHETGDTGCLVLASSQTQERALLAQGAPHVVIRNFLDEPVLRDWLDRLCFRAHIPVRDPAGQVVEITGK